MGCNCKQSKLNHFSYGFNNFHNGNITCGWEYDENDKLIGWICRDENGKIVDLYGNDFDPNGICYGYGPMPKANCSCPPSEPEFNYNYGYGNNFPGIGPWFPGLGVRPLQSQNNSKMSYSYQQQQYPLFPPYGPWGLPTEKKDDEDADITFTYKTGYVTTCSKKDDINICITQNVENGMITDMYAYSTEFNCDDSWFKEHYYGRCTGPTYPTTPLRFYS